ncbi:MAG: NAD(P)H-dependent oxidoreductase subunit E [Candidatus Bathyarchaeia archaeon]
MCPDRLKLADLERMGDLRELIKELTELDRIIGEYRDEPGSLMLTIRRIQDLFGYVPLSALRRLSEKSKIPLSELIGIVSFYSFFSTAPKGEHTIKVCLGTSCYVRGGEKVLNFLSKELKLEPGGTSADGKFSLEAVRCLGCCGLSPVVAIDDKVYTRVSPNRMRGILREYA